MQAVRVFLSAHADFAVSSKLSAALPCVFNAHLRSGKYHAVWVVSSIKSTSLSESGRQS